MTASVVNPRALEPGYLSVGGLETRLGSVSLDPLPAPAKWNTKRLTWTPILKDLLPPYGWDYWAVEISGASSITEA